MPHLDPAEMLASATLHQNQASESLPEANPRLKPHSTPATLCWLEKNYELSEGVCIPRNVVYFNYVDFCGRHGMQPVNAASFGKVLLKSLTFCNDTLTKSSRLYANYFKI